MKEQRGQLRINNTTFSSETVYNPFIVSNRELPYPGVGGSMIIELAGREVLPSSTFQSLSIDRDFCLNLDSDLLGLFLKSEDKTAASEWSVKILNICHSNCNWPLTL